MVIVEEDVTPDDDVFFRHSGAGASPEAIGRFRTDADTANADQVNSARWLTSAVAGGLAVLGINLPQQ